VNPARQCSNDRTIMSVMKETFETVMIESNFPSLNQKMELIETKMTTCSETLEQNALVAIANQDALIQKLDTNQDDLTSKMDTNHDDLTSKMNSMNESQNQKLELIETKMTTCSETLEENALAAIANQDALIQKLGTNQDDLTSRMDSMHDLIERQDLTNRLDSLQDLVEGQRDLITNQTSTIERQNELIDRQSELIINQTEMLTSISNRIKNANFLEDCFVKCSLTIDNRVDSVSYNGLELAVTGTLDNYLIEKSFNFNSCDQYRPGVLTIKGFDTNLAREDNCWYGGLLLHCIANDISNPWHNFVTDQTHWKVSDGSTPCSKNNGWISYHFKKMKDAGAIKIWSNAKRVTLIGTPD